MIRLEYYLNDKCLYVKDDFGSVSVDSVTIIEPIHVESGGQWYLVYPFAKYDGPIPYHFGDVLKRVIKNV